MNRKPKRPLKTRVRRAITSRVPGLANFRKMQKRHSELFERSMKKWGTDKDSNMVPHQLIKGWITELAVVNHLTGNLDKIVNRFEKFYGYKLTPFQKEEILKRMLVERKILRKREQYLTKRTRTGKN